MRFKSLLFAAFIYHLIGFYTISTAQVKVATSWNTTQAIELIQSFEQLELAGANVLFLPLSTPQQVIQDASFRGFEIYFQLPNNWNTTPLNLQIPDRLRFLMDDERIRLSVQGIVISRHPNLELSEVSDSIINLAELIKQETGVEAYIITRKKTGFDLPFFLEFYDDRSEDALGYIVSSFDAYPRIFYDSLLSYSQNSSMVIFDGSEFVQALNEYPSNSTIARAFANEREPIVSLPSPKEKQIPVNLPAIFLTSVLVLFLLILKLFHVYSSSIPRYFLGHSFFIIDIFERHYRFGISSLVFFLMISSVTGMSWLVVFESSLTEASQQFLIYHLSFFDSRSGIFLSGFIFAFLINLFLISWLASVSLRPEIFSQSATLIMWPQHIILFMFIVMMLLATNGVWSQTYPYFLAVMVCIPFISFIVASFDFATRPTFSVPVHLLLTIVLMGLLLFASYWLLKNVWQVGDFISMVGYLNS